MEFSCSLCARMGSMGTLPTVQNSNISEKQGSLLFYFFKHFLFLFCENITVQCLLYCHTMTLRPLTIVFFFSAKQ